MYTQVHRRLVHHSSADFVTSRSLPITTHLNLTFTINLIISITRRSGSPPQMVRDPVIVPYLADPVLDPYPAPRERSPDPPLPVAPSSRYNEVEEADSLISILSVPPPAYSSHVEVAPPYPGPGPGPGGGEVEAIAIERETSPLEVAETLPVPVIPIPDRERSPPIGCEQ